MSIELEDAGWEFDGEGWIDPLSKLPVATVLANTITHSDGSRNDVHQVCRPPIRWRYTEEQAAYIQSQRT